MDNCNRIGHSVAAGLCEQLHDGRADSYSARDRDYHGPDQFPSGAASRIVSGVSSITLTRKIKSLSENRIASLGGVSALFNPRNSLTIPAVEKEQPPCLKTKLYGFQPGAIRGDTTTTEIFAIVLIETDIMPFGYQGIRCTNKEKVVDPGSFAMTAKKTNDSAAARRLGCRAH